MELPSDLQQQLIETRKSVNELAASICPALDPKVEVEEIKCQKTGRAVGLWANVTGSSDSPVLYAMHGGGYFSVDHKLTLPMYIELAKKINFNVYSVDYRLVPDVKFPENVKDVVDGYLYLLNDRKISPKKIVLYGDSAGGGMVAYLLNALMGPNQHHPDQPDNLFYQLPKPVPRPHAAVMSSPWLDLTMSTPCYEANREVDLVDGPFFPLLVPFLKYFVQPYTKLEQSQGLGINPTGWDCPVRITAGDTETLLDDVIVFARKMQRVGVQTSFKCYHDLVHCGFLDESIASDGNKRAYDLFWEEQAQWIRDLGVDAPKSKL